MASEINERYIFLLKKKLKKNFLSRQNSLNEFKQLEAEIHEAEIHKAELNNMTDYIHEENHSIPNSSPTSVRENNLNYDEKSNSLNSCFRVS